MIPRTVQRTQPEHSPVIRISSRQRERHVSKAVWAAQKASPTTLLRLQKLRNLNFVLSLLLTILYTQYDMRCQVSALMKACPNAVYANGDGRSGHELRCCIFDGDISPDNLQVSAESWHIWESVLYQFWQSFDSTTAIESVGPSTSVPDIRQFIR